MVDLDRETALRAAAFEHVRRLAARHDPITSDHLKAGFQFQGERVPLVNPQRGIFKPRAMRHLLSIRTVFPRRGAKVWYDDQRQVHAQIFEGHETVDYAFMGEDPEAADNRWLHQAQFREAVIAAYGGHCAICGLPETRLLDAAHIMADRDERLGQPIIPNGLPLSKIHHAAFDAQLIGIDADFRLHVSDQLLGQNDGPVLEALKGLAGTTIHLPSRPQDFPDRERLAQRSEMYRSAA